MLFPDEHVSETPDLGIVGSVGTPGALGSSRDLTRELPKRLEEADGSVGVVYVRLPEDEPALLDDVAERLATLPLGDEAYHLGDGELVVVGAGDVEPRVLDAVGPLAGAGVLLGGAVFPEDAGDAAALVDVAAGRAGSVTVVRSRRFALRYAPVAVAVLAIVAAIAATISGGVGDAIDEALPDDLPVGFDSGRGEEADDPFDLDSTRVTLAPVPSTEVTTGERTASSRLTSRLRSAGTRSSSATSSSGGGWPTYTGGGATAEEEPATTETTAAPSRDTRTGDDGWDRDREWDGDWGGDWGDWDGDRDDERDEWEDGGSDSADDDGGSGTDDGDERETTTTTAQETTTTSPPESTTTSTTSPPESTTTTAPPDDTTTTTTSCNKRGNGCYEPDDDD